MEPVIAVVTTDHVRCLCLFANAVRRRKDGWCQLIRGAVMLDDFGWSVPHHHVLVKCLAGGLRVGSLLIIFRLYRMSRYHALGLLDNFTLLVCIVALSTSRSLAVAVLRILASTCLCISFQHVPLIVDVVLLKGLCELLTT